MKKSKSFSKRKKQIILVNKNDTYLDNEMARPTIYPEVFCNNKH